MPNVPINLTGESYKSRSGQLSNQKTQNFYPELIDNPNAKGKYVLQSFPGPKLFSSGESGVDRGMFEFQGLLYKVTGETLYSISSDGTHTPISPISGTGRCIFEGIGNDLIIVSGGVVWVYVVSPTIDDFSDTGKYLITEVIEGNVNAIQFKDDGLAMYILGDVNDTVYQYILTQPWNIETATYDSKSLSVVSEESIPEGLFFKPDGTKMYIVGFTNDTLYQYSLSTAWDISTGVYDSVSYTPSAETTSTSDLFFSPDGVSLYIVSLSDTTVYQYSLGTAWDLSSLSYSGKSLSISEGSSPSSFYISNDGLTLYTLANNTGIVYQYTMTTAWDVSTGSYASLSVTLTSGSTEAGLTFNSDETVMFVSFDPVGEFSRRIGQYSSVGLVTNANLETPNAVAHLNNQAIYDGDNARWVSSDVGDATSINGLNYASAESDADKIIRPYSFGQVLYLFGEKTIEPWINSGVGSPPFDRVEGGIIPVGLAAIHSTANNDNYLYFLGDDNSVYSLRGYNKKNRSNIALSNKIESYTTISDAIGLCYDFENQNFYQLTFPTEGKTWCYSESSEQWFELVSEEGRYLGNSQAYAFRKNLIADYRDGKIYELDINTFDENGVSIIRIRDSGPIHGEALGAPGKHIEMTRFELIMQTGVGLSTGQGSDPVVMLSYSDDGGNTFSTERWGKVGGMTGQLVTVEWHGLGRFKERIIRIRTSDPVFYSIHSANADLEPCI